MLGWDINRGVFCVCVLSINYHFIEIGDEGGKSIVVRYSQMLYNAMVQCYSSYWCIKMKLGGINVLAQTMELG